MKVKSSSDWQEGDKHHSFPDTWYLYGYHLIILLTYGQTLRKSIQQDLKYINTKYINIALINRPSFFIMLTKVGALGSERKDSGMGQNPTAKPFCATVRGT